MSDDPVLVDVEDGVATLTLNQPGVRNAMTRDLSRGLVDALERIEGGDARVVVVEGAGPAFCAGGDVNAMVERMVGDMPLSEAVRLVRQTTSRAVQRLHDFYLPTVAKVDGAAFGAGANLAIATDLQLASDETRISFGFRNVGLAVDSGTSYLLPRLVGENVAKELVFTGERIGADRAKELGLFNRVFPADEFDERADELIEDIAQGPTEALRTSKRLIDQGMESSLSQAMTNEAAAQAAVFETADHEEGVEAFMEKREPDFEGA
ncbi:enoyl-CoA hydratase [Halobacteriales archaeon QS_1_68_20]|nr:MAG: enoyl-CoA hydratase [Halobacteriales archaeon QS_1_68_20]